MIKFHVYKDEAEEFRWKAIDGNNENVANGSEGYTRKSDASKGLSNFLAEIQSGEYMAVVED